MCFDLLLLLLLLWFSLTTADWLIILSLMGWGRGNLLNKKNKNLFVDFAIFLQTRRHNVLGNLNIISITGKWGVVVVGREDGGGGRGQGEEWGGGALGGVGGERGRREGKGGTK